MTLTVLLTGSQGFIGSYICRELLSAGYCVIGVDNFSKYGRVVRAHDSHPRFHLIDGDVKDLRSLVADHNFHYIIAGAAMIGGISYFHKFAYDLLAENDKIIAATFDAALERYKRRELNRILVISSSMVFENVDVWPTRESLVSECPPPSSTYGFQKLATEYYCKGAKEQYGLPYTIVRPFNCVGVGEDDALIGDNESGGMMLSHVLPDIVKKVLSNSRPLQILGSGDQVRCYTNGRDIARGIRLAMESNDAVCEDFNISSRRPTSVTELVKCVWSRVYDSLDGLELESIPPYRYDVQYRVPDVHKAESILKFTADISLEESVDEVVEYVSSRLSGSDSRKLVCA